MEISKDVFQNKNEGKHLSDLKTIRSKIEFIINTWAEEKNNLNKFYNEIARIEEIIGENHLENVKNYFIIKEEQLSSCDDIVSELLLEVNKLINSNKV